MEKRVETVERIVKIKKIAGVLEDGTIALEMTDDSVITLAFSPDDQNVYIKLSDDIVDARPTFEEDSGVFNGFAIRKAVE